MVGNDGPLSLVARNGAAAALRRGQRKAATVLKAFKAEAGRGQRMGGVADFFNVSRAVRFAKWRLAGRFGRTAKLDYLRL